MNLITERLRPREAADAALRHDFGDMDCAAVWCSHFGGSRRICRRHRLTAAEWRTRHV